MKKTLLIVVSLLLAGCANFNFGGGGQHAEDAKALSLSPVSYSAVSGWNQDNQTQALIALRKSCAVLLKRDPAATVAPTAIAGRVADWLPACNAAMGPVNARMFFQNNFNAYEMTTPKGDNGLFTGYYETMLRGSLTRSARYNVPLYRKPKDLVMVELGDFRPAMRGERIAGHVVDGKLKPYPDRAAIERGALNGQGLEIAYVEDADAAFFSAHPGLGPRAARRRAAIARRL